MQNQVHLNLICPKHGEKIISASITATGETQMSCLKCLMQQQIPIEQLAQQLAELRALKIKKLIEFKNKSEKRLRSLSQLFITLKEQFNKIIDEIIKTIKDGINNHSSEIEQLKQPIQQLNITQVSNHIMELIKQPFDGDSFLRKDKQIRNNIIQQYVEVVQSLNKQIKVASDWEKQNQDILQQIDIQLPFYKLSTKEEGISGCHTLIMDKDENILVNGQSFNLQIWDLNTDGASKLRQTLRGHSSTIRSLCISQKGYWLISGSQDNSMRIWKRDSNNSWICSQILKDCHQNWVTGVMMDNNEEQFISCSFDKTIKIWMNQKNSWECAQTLNDHTNGVYFLSLNCDCNLLASSGVDKLRIWEKDKKYVWKQKQVISDPNNDKHLRIKFIDNNELIASTEKQGKILIYSLNKVGLFQITQELQLSTLQEQSLYCFPIIFNKESGVVIVRNNDQHTYILKKSKNGLQVHQQLNGDYQAGYMMKNGKSLILYNSDNECLEILR